MTRKDDGRIIRIVHPICCGLDVHKESVSACVIFPDDKGEEQCDVKVFGTFTDDLMRLRDWLAAHNCPVVAMESTGVYWRPVHNVLEDSVQVVLVNARDMHNVPGRKTDIRDRPERYGLYPDGDVAPPALQADGRTEGKATAPIRFSEALRHRAFLFIVLSEGIRMMALGAIMNHIMPYLNVLHVPRSTAGMIAGGLAVLSILGRFGFGWLADLFDRRLVAAVASGLMTVGIFLLCYVESGWVMILFLLLFPIGFGGMSTVRAAITQGYFGRESFGRLIGLIMGASAVGGIIGPTLAGYMFDTTGSYTLTWILLGIATSLIVPLMLSLGPQKKAM